MAVQEHLYKIFVGGLHYDTREESLSQYFSKYGEVNECIVKINPDTGKSRGFGFVAFNDPSPPAVVNSIQEDRPHMIDGKEVDTKRIVPKPSKMASVDPNPHAKVKKVFVGGLKDQVTEDEMQNYFSQFGTVQEVKTFVDQTTGKRKGFAFVSFMDFDSADKCYLKACEHPERKVLINGASIEIKKAVEQNKNQPGGQQGGNRGFNNNMGNQQQRFNNQGNFNQGNMGMNNMGGMGNNANNMGMGNMGMNNMGNNNMGNNGMNNMGSGNMGNNMGGGGGNMGNNMGGGVNMGNNMGGGNMGNNMGGGGGNMGNNMGNIGTMQGSNMMGNNMAMNQGGTGMMSNQGNMGGVMNNQGNMGMQGNMGVQGNRMMQGSAMNNQMGTMDNSFNKQEEYNNQNQYQSATADAGYGQVQQDGAYDNGSGDQWNGNQNQWADQGPYNQGGAQASIQGGNQGAMRKARGGFQTNTRQQAMPYNTNYKRAK